jgi:hypothetical protein
VDIKPFQLPTSSLSSNQQLIPAQSKSDDAHIAVVELHRVSCPHTAKTSLHCRPCPGGEDLDRQRLQTPPDANTRLKPQRLRDAKRVGWVKRSEILCTASTTPRITCFDTKQHHTIPNSIHTTTANTGSTLVVRLVPWQPTQFPFQPRIRGKFWPPHGPP